MCALCFLPVGLFCARLYRNSFFFVRDGVQEFAFAIVALQKNLDGSQRRM